MLVARRRPGRRWDVPAWHVLHTIATVVAVDRPFEERGDHLAARLVIAARGD